MSEFRRYFVPGGTYFFTVVTYNRYPIFAEAFARELLGKAIRECRDDWTFRCPAIVLLHDHLHAIWTLPPGDAGYSARWSRIKKEFSSSWLSSGGHEEKVTPAQESEHRRGIWQPRFWEHTIRDEDEFDAYFDYIHFNPVKHKYVPCPRDWSSSTFGHWVVKGVYDADWACMTGRPEPVFSRIKNDCGEPI